MSTETLAEETVSSPELAAYKDKAPTHLHYGYAVYLKEKTGYGPEIPAEGETTEEWEAFVKSIQLAVVLYGRYQKSPENEARKVVEKEEREAAQEKAKAERAAAAEAKKAEKEKAREAAKEAAETDGTDEAPKRSSKPANKSGKVKPGAASGVEAPF